ncbi:MAG: cob(I)yrinic acid a,c-diamide adenosyltransferase [Candidatus Bathyarchaeota archaeon]
MTTVGHVYLYFGTGGGKTAASLGLALRSLGHGHRVVVVQFLKHWEETGEYRIRDRLKPLYEIRQFGRPGWITSGAEREVSAGGFTANVRSVDDRDKEAANKALDYTERVLASRNPPELLILDEVCLAAHLGIVDPVKLIDVLDGLPEKTDAVLTGRYAPQELINRADFVNEVREVKAPASFISRKGVQF